MSLQSVQADLAARAPDLVVEVTTDSTATVQTAALVHGCEPGQIAKTLCIRVNGDVLLLVTRGDARLDNARSKMAFGGRPRMLGAEEVSELTSHQVGGVCPFGLPRPLPIYLDTSLKVYDEVIPAGGDTHASVRLSVARLAELCGNRWVDACQLPQVSGQSFTALQS
jgi:prolyl-tRNA editing enzyme YbaK/EbsC (Cys-tRNA(Pro) deacylase)